MAAIWRTPSYMEHVVNTYKTLSKIPSIIGAKLDKNGKTITTKLSIRNIDRGSNTHYNIVFKLDEQFNVISKTTLGVNISNQLLKADSPKENFHAVIYEDKTGKENKTFLEVWSDDTLLHSIDLTSLDIHGNVYGDSEFGCLEWSADEKYLVYVAEKKPKKSEPFIKRKPKKEDSEDAEKKVKVVQGEEYLYKKDWGEQLTGKIQSVIVVCEVEAEKFTVVEGLPDTWCPGQVCFTPSGESLIGVAWHVEKYRMGLIYCTNRPSYVFCLNIKSGAFKKLMGEGLSVRSPRVGPLGDLVWLQRTAEGPHHACHRLMWLPAEYVSKLDDPDVNVQDNVRTVIDVVETSIKGQDSCVFHGIYCQSLPRHCFSEDGKRVVFSTPQKNEVRSYVVHLESGELTHISNNNLGPGSTTVTCLRSDVLVAVCSNLTTPGWLTVGKLPAHPNALVEWVELWSPDRGQASCLRDATVRYLEHRHADCTDGVDSFTSIYMGPSTDSNFPLIVWPHGGPHSAFSNVYMLEAAFFHMLGFACVFINYRGSTGAGEKSVRFLPGKVGDADVRDCVKATRDVEEQFPVDRERLVLSGGSHGGFLVTSLSGQYPAMYKAVVTRNPVIDVASMMNTSDIPDWCAVEAGMLYREDGPVTEDQLLALRRCSPITHLHRVTAPTCLLLGSNDKRVPAYQGLEYGRRLRANGVKTKIHMYEDNHTLSSLPAEMDSLINAAAWFIEHLQPAQKTPDSVSERIVTPE